MEQARKPGTRPRGDRAAISMRVPIDQRAIYEARAAELGIPLSSWAAIKLAEAEGLPIPDYVADEIRKAEEKRRHEDELEELQMPRSA